MSDQLGPDPTIHRRRLRSELRKAREAAGRTQRESALAMDWSMSKLIRIETGDVRITTNDLRALLGYYGVDDDRITTLVETARSAREPDRWARYRDVATPEYRAFLGYEFSATIIRSFEPILVPGLLQTEEYARTVLTEFGSRQIDAAVDLRIERQEILVRESRPPTLYFTMDESVIHHVVGGAGVMRRQLAQLRQRAAEPNIHLRIVGFDTGLYPRMRIPYVLFEFDAAEDEEVLYIENATDELVIKENSPNEAAGNGPLEYLESFWRLEQLASEEESLVLLDQAMARLAG